MFLLAMLPINVYLLPMSTINEQAKVAVMALAEGSSISAVAKRLGIPQQTLSRFVTKPGASLSLKNFEKIAPYIEPTHWAERVEETSK